MNLHTLTTSLELIGSLIAVVTGIYAVGRFMLHKIEKRLHDMETRRTAWEQASEIRRNEQFRILRASMLATIRSLRENGKGGGPDDIVKG